MASLPARASARRKHSWKLPFSRLFKALLTLVFLGIGATFAQPQTPETPCRTLDQEKWRWHSLFEDYLPPAWDKKPETLPESSSASCLNCLLWMDDAFPPSLNTRSVQEAWTAQRARCLQAVGMQDEALRLYRRLLAQDPDDTTLSASLGAMIEILYENRNIDTVIATYRALPAVRLDLVPPEGLYLVAQSLYLKNQDEEADQVLLRIPKDSELYPYALYEQAQVAFRKGDPDQALTLLQGVAEIPSDSPSPELLRDSAQLSRARLLFQTGRIQEAIEGFRSLSQSRFLLAEALMGMGWCYQALGQPSRAISYFRSLGEAPLTDADSWAAANLEVAHLYSQAGLQEEAFGIFGQVQSHLETLIAAYQEMDHSPEGLSELAEQLLSTGRTSPAPSVQGAQKFIDRDSKSEIAFFLGRQSYTSPRLKELLHLWRGLGDIQALLTPPTEGEARKEPDPDDPFRYPPLTQTPTALDPDTVHLLDASLALLDMELRLDETENLLGLGNPQVRLNQRRQRTAFYRAAFQETLFGPGVIADPELTLGRMQTMVRNLPFSLEVRSRILEKLVSLKEAITGAQGNLQRWESGIEKAAARPQEPLRLVVLREWMVLVRTLVLLRSWVDRPPAFCLSEILRLPGEKEASGQHQNLLRTQVSERVAAQQERLRAVLQQEIGKVHERRVREFERLLTRSQLYYAEALLHRQEQLLEAIQTPSSP